MVDPGSTRVCCKTSYNMGSIETPEWKPREAAMNRPGEIVGYGRREQSPPGKGLSVRSVTGTKEP